MENKFISKTSCNLQRTSIVYALEVTGQGGSGLAVGKNTQFLQSKFLTARFGDLQLVLLVTTAFAVHPDRRGRKLWKSYSGPGGCGL